MPAASRLHIHRARSSKLLNQRTWSDFEKLFEANGGVQSGCWCMFNHTPSPSGKNNYSRNKKDKKSLVAQSHSHGILVYCGDKPVGWCQFGPPEELPRLDHTRGYKATEEGAWRLTCLFVDKPHRRSGFARLAVADSIEAMRKMGVQTIEAFPIVGEADASDLWTGTPSLFEENGFAKVGLLGKRRWIYQLKANA